MEFHVGGTGVSPVRLVFILIRTAGTAVLPMCEIARTLEVPPGRFFKVAHVALLVDNGGIERNLVMFMRYCLPLTLVCLLALTACNTFNEMDAGNTVTAEFNHNFDVQLDSNPTTGYQWQLARHDAKFVQMVGTPQFTPKSVRIGGSGVETFTFKALAKGKTTLDFEYLRPWEKGVAPAKTYSITVQIK